MWRCVCVWVCVCVCVGGGGGGGGGDMRKGKIRETIQSSVHTESKDL